MGLCNTSTVYGLGLEALVLVLYHAVLVSVLVNAVFVSVLVLDHTVLFGLGLRPRGLGLGLGLGPRGLGLGLCLGPRGLGLGLGLEFLVLCTSLVHTHIYSRPMYAYMRAYIH